MKYSAPIFTAILLAVSAVSFAQKKVEAAADLITKTTDSVAVKKGKSFVVQLPVHNRNGDDWAIASPSAKFSFTQSMLGQAGMLPNQPEAKLMFFKTTETGLDSIKFIYKNPRLADKEPEIRMVKVLIQ